MIRCWRKRSLINWTIPEALRVEDMPWVTVQIPLYNEPRVAARVIDAVAAFDWSLDKLRIQVLDDSDDETRAIVADRVTHWSSAGLDI
ncbi:MAG: glycosyl transferase family 2, partial [Desulfobacterales bacterium CG23_combo_of_CG06-09_8_20_14_all_51_8]